MQLRMSRTKSFIVNIDGIKKKKCEKHFFISELSLFLLSQYPIQELTRKITENKKTESHYVNYHLTKKSVSMKAKKDEHHCEPSPYYPYRYKYNSTEYLYKSFHIKSTYCIFTQSSLRLHH